MLKERGPITTGIIVSVVSTFIIAVLTWAFGFFPIIWNKLVALSSWVWGLLTYQVSLPVIGLLGIAGLVVYFTYHLSRKPTLKKRKTEATDFSETETKVLRALAEADGNWLSIDDLAREVVTSRLIIEQAVEKLYANDVVLRAHNLDGPIFRLSPDGRDFAISQGYVSDFPF